MATQNVNIGVNVSDNGTAKKVVQSFKEITNEATKAQRAAEGINIPAGGTSGSRSVAAKYAAPSGSERMMSGEEYGRARASGTGTGASARDFANQAQGLGGLVRLYATYAANVFAVSAAFSALRNAADTANLIKGMNQLGAASGVAMGTLSKSLVEVTDGAISMREAMETVTKATSSGLSSKQILELGKVAKNASQALGVGMEDAVSRLTRGITKLEPELLDELGIFTKIDPAVQKYAQSIGRAASSLTDFERRQAFAIAVLDEGNKKFGQLELDANPYAKFLATLKDVGFTILDIVNKAVVPLVEYLSKSPTALLTVLGAVATLIVRQALPAFGQFKAGLESSAEQAQKRAIARAQDAAEAQKSISEAVRQAADARVENEVAKVVAAEKRITDIKAGSIKKQSALYKILEKDLEDITQKDLKRIDASAKGLETRGLVDQAKAYRDTAQAVRDYQKEKSNYDTALEKEKKLVQDNAKWYSIESITISTAEKAKQQAVRASIVSNAAYQASLVGVTRAMIAVNAAIVQQGITGFDAFTLRVKAGAAAIGGALATIGTVINRFLGVIGILATAYSILDGFMDGASSQVGKFDSAVDKAKSSAENLANTYKKIYENDPFSAQSVQARGTALMEVADSFKEIGEAARTAQEAIDQSWWAQLKEGLGISGVARNFGKSVATQLTTVLKSIDDVDAKNILENSIKNQLKITEVSFDNIAASAKRLGASSSEIKRLQEVVTGLATQAKIAGVASAQFAESYKKVTEQIQKINQKFSVTDDIAVFAINSTAALNELDNLLSQGVTKSAEGLVTALEGIGKGTNIFGNLSAELTPLTAEAAQFKKEFSEGAKQVKDLTVKLTELKTKKINPADFTTEFLGQPTFDQSAFDKAVATLENQRKQTTTDLAIAEQKTNRAKGELEVVSAKVQQSIPRALANSTELLGLRLAGQLSKVSNQVLQGVYASFDSIPELAAKSSQLKIQEIDAQVANTKALQQLTTATVISSAQQKVTAAKATAIQATGTTSQLSANIDLQEAEKELSLLETAVKNPQEALKLLANEQINNTTLAKRLAGTVQDLAARTVEYTASLKQLNQQRLSEQIQGQIATNNARIKQEQNIIKLKQDELKIEADMFQLLSSQENTGLDAKEQLNSQIAINREKQIELNYQQKLLETSKTAAEQAVRASVLPEADRKLAITNIVNTSNSAQKLAVDQKSQELEKSRLDLLKAQSAIVIERITREEASYNRAADFAKVSTDSALQLKQIKLDTELGVQSTMLSNSQLSETVRSEIEYQSTLKLAALEQERAKIQANQEFERQQTANTFAIRKVLAADTGEDGLTEESLRKISEITEQEKIQKATREGAVAQADALYNKVNLVAAATRQAAQEQDRYNQLIATSTTFAESLKSIFGDLGEKVGAFTASLADMVIQNDKNAKAMKLAGEAKQAAYDSQDVKAIAEAEAGYDAQKRKSQKDELSGNIKIVSSAKTLFKEKTFAYKALDKVEKAMHVYRLAMDAKELAVKIGNLIMGTTAKAGAEAADTGITFAGVAARLPAYAAEIYGKTIGQLGPIAGPAVATALVAAMFSMFGKSGGGGSTFTPTAEQRQETQGTAMSYDSQGNKVQTRRGVFGDTEAKSESIAKSLEIIKDNSVEGLFYDNKMLNALTNLTKSLETAAKSLYGITGLRTGSLSGITEGTNTGGGFLGIGGLFSKSTTKEIIDSGIQLKGTFLELVQGIKGTINTFETVSTTVKKSGFFGIGGSTKTSVSTEFTDLAEKNPKAFKAISDSFGFAANLLYSTAELAGIADTVVETAISKVPVDELVSLRGLKGEELTRELSAVISAVLDDASLAIFSSFEGYAKFGEGMLETVQRVIDSNKKVNQQVKNLGIDISGLTFAVTETLVDLAGGLEKFLEQSNFFRENFLTEAERLTPVQKAVTEEMARLKFASVDTRAEFKLLVQGLDLNTDAGRENYQALMNVAEGFDEVATAAENLANSAKSLLTKYVELSGTESEIINMQREAILAGTDPALVAAQKYIFALEDVKTAQTNLTNARKTEGDSLKTTVSNLKNYADSLRKFNQSLLLGAQSTLTPQQKYLESKSQFDAILATATKPATTAAEKADRDAAIGQLQGASTSFLDASRIYNASSAQYTEDFGLVQRALTSTADALDAQSTDAEKQLSALNLINDSVLSVTDAIAKLDLAKQVADALKSGATASYAVGTKTANITGGTVYGTQGSTIDLASAKTFMINAVSEISASSNPEPMVRGLYDMLTTTWGLNSYQVADVSGYSRQQVLDYFGAWGLPAFAAGTNYVPEDMLAQIHRGERIIPAADNEQLMQNLNNRDEANRVLVTEIRNLRNEVKQLRDQQAKETGNIIMANLDAQQRNAEHIGEVISTTTQQSDWNAKVKEAVKLR